MLVMMNSYTSSLLSRSRWHREHGFPLYEILVVVALSARMGGSTE